ncbi:MAG: hypothetical protein M5U25_18535 [Planctomycetota bacterium]|nr:hypothetical protein [Planctomycetota bacterium]
MNRTTCTVIFFCFALSATPLFASSLSVVALAEALKNPALEDINSEGFAAALEPIQAALLNQPADEDENAAFQQRISAIARHRNTRVGKLFFAALAATPDVENLPDNAEFATVDAHWPLALRSSAQVRVEWRLVEKQWRICTLQVALDGVAAAPISGMAPYFGGGELRTAMLNLEAIDYLVGRDPADRELPELERPAFDFDAALVNLFEAETGACAALLEKLAAGVKPQVERAKRLEALKPHLTGDPEYKALEAADADPARREAFWAAVFEQLKQARQGARPASVPSRTDAGVSVRVRAGGKDAVTAALRLKSGEVALAGFGSGE